ncbi:MAG: hypothetical protein MK081_09085 [Flavobacteriales bacterium]|nr:hypothetical protein [Flavobacteriales bacterium]
MAQKITYRVWSEKPHSRYLDLEAHIPTGGRKELTLQLPAWRPGRYELGNFARNIRSLSVSVPSDSEKNINAVKTGKDTWQVNCDGHDSIVVRYDYYAAELNAGSTWVDADQIYVNPVNCFLYLPDQQDTPYEITVEMEEDFRLATGMKVEGNTMFAKDVQEVMDCPFIASPDLWERTYEVDGKQYHIWIQGRHRLDESRLLQEFEAFTKAQLTAFGSIPCEDYHFIFHFPDHATRHGVEHENSTVIALGPAEKLMKVDGYDEMLGISCHELYHTWNIKSIRPKEMMPYDFSKENYSRLGYVAEGVTTYYGDLYLYRSQVFNEQKYLSLLAGQIQRHLHNPGRLNLSVADSSFDTWLDGYQSGIPHRKVSIYTEGCLTAFMTDVEIMRSTNNERSLDDVMKIMYERFGLKGEGYTEADYRHAVTEVAEKDLNVIFDQLIYGTDDYTEHLNSALAYLGISFDMHDDNTFMQQTGVFHFNSNGKVKVHDVWPDSPGDRAGLGRGDELISLNGILVDELINERIQFTGRDKTIAFIRDRALYEAEIELDREVYYPRVSLKRKESANEAFQKWAWLEKKA